MSVREIQASHLRELYMDVHHDLIRWVTGAASTMSKRGSSRGRSRTSTRSSFSTP